MMSFFPDVCNPLSGLRLCLILSQGVVFRITEGDPKTPFVKNWSFNIFKAMQRVIDGWTLLQSNMCL